jgi:triosephosphate isomerase
VPPFSGGRKVVESMRTPVVAGNWKMNGDSASVSILIDGILGNQAELTCEVLVFPPFVYLGQVAGQLTGSGVLLGAQDVDAKEKGAVTGGVSASMLHDVGCRYVIVGHSERRTVFGEDDDTVAEKFEQCLENKLKPILCVGESLEERNAGATLEVVTSQLEHVLNRVGVQAMGSAMIAYEPVWAIGTGESATPGQAEEVHSELRACVARADATLAASIRILYGGSVTPENAAILFAGINVDGALVGGASLKAESFIEICRAAENAVS